MRWKKLAGQLLIGLSIAIVADSLLPPGKQVVRSLWSQLVEWKRLPPPITAPVPDSVTPGVTVQEVRVLRQGDWDILTITGEAVKVCSVRGLCMETLQEVRPHPRGSKERP